MALPIFNPKTSCSPEFSDDRVCSMGQEGSGFCLEECELADVDTYFKEAGLPENSTLGELIMFAESMIEITDLSANPKDLNG